jgi:hypothetical protein
MDSMCRQTDPNSSNIQTRTVVLSEVAYERIQAYANFVGISLEVAASDAISEWMNSTGDLVVEALQRKEREAATKPRLTIVSSKDSLAHTQSFGTLDVRRAVSERTSKRKTSFGGKGK